MRREPALPFTAASSAITMAVSAWQSARRGMRCSCDPSQPIGEPTTFDFGFFANSKVMGLDAQPLAAPLATDQVFELRKR